MLIDITLKITPKMVMDAQGNEKKALVGHLGTHFDVMDKEFPLEYTRRNAIVFDVSGVKDRDIMISDIDLSKIRKEMFVAFYTGFIEKEGYGSKAYFTAHPQLSNELIDELLKAEISMIGVDFAGLRRGKEHTLKDQHCADRNVFVIENLCSPEEICARGNLFTAHTYPMNYSNMTGLPCRVVAEI
ncbi:MAG: cyclase family protein [Candidatus Choladocola sp.]|nr:cyclase family protein [Candidatus Choladocola sp.]